MSEPREHECECAGHCIMTGTSFCPFAPKESSRSGASEPEPQGVSHGETREEVPCECARCNRCGGAGVEDWYLGDEFNSSGTSTCGTCRGTGVSEDDCPIHHG